MPRIVERRLKIRDARWVPMPKEGDPAKHGWGDERPVRDRVRGARLTQTQALTRARTVADFRDQGNLPGKQLRDAIRALKPGQIYDQGRMLYRVVDI